MLTAKIGHVILLSTTYGRYTNMFVRTKTSPNSPRKAIQVVENYRDSPTGRVRQRIVEHIGIASDQHEETKLKAIGEEYIAKAIMEQHQSSPQLTLLEPPSHTELLSNIQQKKRGRPKQKLLQDILPVEQVNLDMLAEEARIVDGVHEVAGKLYDALNYHKLLKNKKYNTILKDLVLSRISRPQSKMATCKALERYYMREHDLDAIYRTMDHLYDKIDDMRILTFEATRRLLPATVDLILFDVTTLHFESTEVDELRKFGFSKNFRFNTTQVTLALATNSDGLPIGYELFEGNKAEVNTLIEVIDSWRGKFNIGEVCFIGDRAMFSGPNLAALDARGYKYIVAAKLKALPEVMRNKILDESYYRSTEVCGELTWASQFRYEEADLSSINGASRIKAYQELITENQKRKLVVSYSSKRAKCDRKNRETVLAKIAKQLDRSSNSSKLISNSAIKKYTSSRGSSESYIDYEKVEEDGLWDGIHGVITNVDDGMTIGSILTQYRRLVKIEECFRVQKHSLKMRPIYHFKPERIMAHIAICYMAFTVVKQLEYRVRLTKKLSIDSIIEELNSVQSSIYVHKVTKDRYRMPGCFSNAARKIYSAIGVKRNLEPTSILHDT